jgi:hypothetical protein
LRSNLSKGLFTATTSDPPGATVSLFGVPQQKTANIFEVNKAK